jgi:hypothetical protein
MAKAERLELRLDVELREKLDELAGRRNVAVSVIVRRAIIDAHRAAFPDAPVKRREPTVREVLNDPQESLATFHFRLWDRPPSPIQQKLYAAHGRGYASGVAEEQVDAVLTTAFYIAPVRPDDAVVILAPRKASALTLERITAARSAAQAKPFAATVTETIQRMKIGIPAPWPPGTPRVWVAVGVTDDAPTWLRKRLVEIAP